MPFYINFRRLVLCSEDFYGILWILSAFCGFSHFYVFREFASKRLSSQKINQRVTVSHFHDFQESPNISNISNNQIVSSRVGVCGHTQHTKKMYIHVGKNDILWANEKRNITGKVSVLSKSRMLREVQNVYRLSFAQQFSNDEVSRSICSLFMKAFLLKPYNNWENLVISLFPLHFPNFLLLFHQLLLAALPPRNPLFFIALVLNVLYSPICIYIFIFLAIFQQFC